MAVLLFICSSLSRACKLITATGLQMYLPQPTIRESLHISPAVFLRPWRILRLTH